MNKKISFPIAITIIVVLAVLVGGLVAWQFFGMPKVEIPEFRPAEKIQPASETANWRIYRNGDFSIEFKYPNNWIALEGENFVNLENINKFSQKISILKSSEPSPDKIRYKLLEKKPVFVDKLQLNRELFQGKFEYNKDNYYVRVFIPQVAILYQGDFLKEDSEEFLLLFNKILSTFKFIASTPNQNSPIRNVNLKELLEDYFYQGKDTSYCINKEQLITIEYIKYYDFNNDGSEEAIVRAFSCATGTAGADINSVFKLLPSGEITEIKINRNDYRDSWKDYGLRVENGKLLETLPIYAPTDSNCCPTRGIREITYKFLNDEFVVDNVIEYLSNKNRFLE